MADKPLNLSAAPPPGTPDGVGAAMSELQFLIDQERHDRKMSSIGDARWMLWLCIALFFPVVGIYFVLPPDEADVATQFIQIVGLVVAGWGAVRVLLNHRQARVKKTSLVYMPIFLIFFLFYSQLLMSGVSLRYAPNLVQMFRIQDTLRKK